MRWRGIAEGVREAGGWGGGSSVAVSSRAGSTSWRLGQEAGGREPARADRTTTQPEAAERALTVECSAHELGQKREYPVSAEHMAASERVSEVRRRKPSCELGDASS